MKTKRTYHTKGTRNMKLKELLYLVVPKSYEREGQPRKTEN